MASVRTYAGGAAHSPSVRMVTTSWPTDRSSPVTASLAIEEHQAHAGSLGGELAEHVAESQVGGDDPLARGDVDGRRGAHGGDRGQRHEHLARRMRPQRHEVGTQHLDHPWRRRPATVRDS